MKWVKKKSMWLELRSVFTHLSHDSLTRAIVLSGAGTKAFTTGLDIKAAFGMQQPSPSSSTTTTTTSPPGLALGGDGDSRPPQTPHQDQGDDTARIATSLRRHIAEFQDCVSAIERCEKPVIAALHGHTIGLGVEIALCCDVRLCAAGTQFAVKEVELGFAADIGALSRLGKVVGSGSWVKDVCLSGRVFGAEEARKVGFVSWLAPTPTVESSHNNRHQHQHQGGGKQAVIEEALRWAGLVAGKSPVAVQGTKELLNWSQDHTVQDGEFFLFFLFFCAIWEVETHPPMRDKRADQKIFSCPLS